MSPVYSGALLRSASYANIKSDKSLLGSECFCKNQQELQLSSLGQQEPKLSALKNQQEHNHAELALKSQRMALKKTRKKRLSEKASSFGQAKRTQLRSLSAGIKMLVLSSKSTSTKKRKTEDYTYPLYLLKKEILKKNTSLSSFASSTQEAQHSSKLLVVAGVNNIEYIAPASPQLLHEFCLRPVSGWLETSLFLTCRDQATPSEDRTRLKNAISKRRVI